MFMPSRIFEPNRGPLWPSGHNASSTMVETIMAEEYTLRSDYCYRSVVDDNELLTGTFENIFIYKIFNFASKLQPISLQSCSLGTVGFVLTARDISVFASTTGTFDCYRTTVRRRVENLCELCSIYIHVYTSSAIHPWI